MHLGLAATLEPATHEKDQGGYCFPYAGHYQLRQHKGYKSNHIYACEYNPEMREVVQDRVLRIRTPPHMTPTFVDGTFKFLPPPGMIQMIPGIPFVQWIGNPVMVQHPEYYAMLLNLATELRAYTWGRPESLSQRGIEPFVSLGLKKNMRSTPCDGDDGSYSLGVTVIEEGHGIVAPADQPSSADASRQHILTLLARMYLHLLPLVIARVELELLRFNHEDNNIPGFGSWGGALSSCQLNLSSDKFRDLQTMIGSAQGGWHKDKRDNKE